VDRGSDGGSAWLTAEFRGATDAPESLAHWPADYRIRVTYRLAGRSLRVEANVDNPDRRPLPFGLGYHPYFRVPLTASGAADDCWVTAPAHGYWELQESLPTGRVLPVDAGRDLTEFRRFRELNLDDVLTRLRDMPAPETDGLVDRGIVREGQKMPALFLQSSPAFRELVAFTPPHRQAICLEPYTCPTDAINLQARGVDAGLLVLPPGGTWSAVVEMAV
jgi:aldose 1-epimerase